MNDANQFLMKLGPNRLFECHDDQHSKFIHVSDVHLGSHQFRNEYRPFDFINAFRELLFIAIEHEVNFIICGGDIFNSLELLPGILDEVVELLKDFHEYVSSSIPIISIEGNHDIRRHSLSMRFSTRGQSWLKFLSNLGLIILLDVDITNPPEKMFEEYDVNKKKGGKVTIGNAIIYGTRYLGENVSEYMPKICDAIPRERDHFQILIQHFGIQGQMRNVPGTPYNSIMPLKNKIDYLALGHYHLQFTIDNWVYNPGSSEAACSIDSSFQRGIFIVEVSKVAPFHKRVIPYKLKNRKVIWKTIYFPRSLFGLQKVEDYILFHLKDLKRTDSETINFRDSNIPVLYLKLMGKKPFIKHSLKEKELLKKLSNQHRIVDLKLYQKFNDPHLTIDKFVS